VVGANIKSMIASPQTRITPEQYLEVERASESRSEYYNGYVYAMSGASMPHFLITGNLTHELRKKLEERCIVGSTDLKVRVSRNGLHAYPDVLVICGEPKLADRRNDILLNPTVIIEVLSPSTEAYDRGFRFHQYQLVESLQEYGLVSQTEARVEIFRRQANGEWLLVESLGLDAVCHFKSIACEIALAAIYLKVNFDAAPSAPPTPDPNEPR
jgi:Uma2 family endonuclease